MKLHTLCFRQAHNVTVLHNNKPIIMSREKTQRRQKVLSGEDYNDNYTKLAPLGDRLDRCQCPDIGYSNVKTVSTKENKDFERNVIKATGELQEQLGCGVSFHPGRYPEAPFEILRLYAESGGRMNKAVMSHLVQTFDKEKLEEFAELGSYCQFDLFGTEGSYDQFNVACDMPSDTRRLELMRSLVDEGKADRILMSHDIHTKHRLARYGGHGYSHILNNVVPRMKRKGFSEQNIEMITVQNPANWLAMPKDEETNRE